MKTKLAILCIAVFTSIVGFVLYQLGVGDMHNNVVWALGTSVIFLVTLLINVWMFFAIAGEEAYSWEK
jgi:hydrogenase-4 membrane subunit HyfE